MGGGGGRRGHRDVREPVGQAGAGAAWLSGSPGRSPALAPGRCAEQPQVQIHGCGAEGRPPRASPWLRQSPRSAMARFAHQVQPTRDRSCSGLGRQRLGLRSRDRGALVPHPLRAQPCRCPGDRTQDAKRSSLPTPRAAGGTPGGGGAGGPEGPEGGCPARCQAGGSPRTCWRTGRTGRSPGCCRVRRKP